MNEVSTDIKAISKDEKIKELGQKSIPKLILGYSVTTFFALFLNSIYSLVDAVFVGYGVGLDALGAISAVFPFTVFQGAIATMIGGGAAIIVSNLLGKGDRKKAGEIVLSAAILFWTIAIVITALGLIFIEPLLNMLGIAENLKGYAKQYLTIILACNIFSTGFSSVMRAEGKMLYALLQWVVPISVNIILDAIFLLVLDMGVKGAAYATLISQVIGFISAIIFFTKFSSIQFKGAKFNSKSLGSVLTIGLPSLVQQGSIAIALMLLNSVFKVIGGEDLQITYGIVNKIFTICIVPFTAITQALQPIVGYNYGAGKPKRITDAIKWTILLSVIASLIPLIFCEAIPGYLIKIFTKDTTVVAEGALALRYLAIAFPLMFLPSVAGSLFQSVGRKISASLLFAINFIFVPPFALLLGKLFGTEIIWLSFPLASIISSLITIYPLVYFFKKYNAKDLVEVANIVY